MATVGLRRAPMTKTQRRQAIAGWIFVLPWVISLLVFTTYPVLWSAYLSFTDYSILQTPKWIGLGNYERMFTGDPSFWTSVKNSAFYALISVPLRLVAALALAMILNMGVRAIGVYRTIFYLPALAPPVAASIVFVLMLDPSDGVVNAVLQSFGLPRIGWFQDPDWAKPALILMSTWGIGVETLVFLAGLKEIPRDLTDAAEVDGAGPWSRFRNITVPLLSPVILFNLVIGVINSFQVFTQALVVGSTRGDPVESTLMYMIVIYRNAFSYFAMGYASALAMVLFLAIVVVTLLIFRSARFWVYYEGGDR